MQRVTRVQVRWVYFKLEASSGAALYSTPHRRKRKACLRGSAFRAARLGDDVEFTQSRASGAGNGAVRLEKQKRMGQLVENGEFEEGQEIEEAELMAHLDQQMRSSNSIVICAGLNSG